MSARFLFGRRASVRAVNFAVRTRHRRSGATSLQVSLISPTGFIASGSLQAACNDAVMVQLPALGWRKAYLAWTDGLTCGFQFRRILSPGDFARLWAAVQP